MSIAVCSGGSQLGEILDTPLSLFQDLIYLPTLAYSSRYIIDLTLRFDLVTIRLMLWLKFEVLMRRSKEHLTIMDESVRK